MKVKVFQPPYPLEGTPAAAETCARWMLGELDALKSGEQDLILLPEYANAAGLSESPVLREFAENQGREVLRKISAAAGRLASTIVTGAVVPDGSRWVNRTFLFDACGEAVFSYDKVHLTDFEADELGLAPGAAAKVFEYNGLRLAFAVCFDLYFPEYFAALAAQNPDIILAPSYQRSESAERICLIAAARALDSGAYLLRSSYTTGNPGKAGQSLVASPEGVLLANAGAAPGVLTVEFDPGRKFEKTAYHCGPRTEHRALIETHRRPALYRPYPDRAGQLAGTPFPLLCAHRGLSDACPENTLPSFAAAIAAGAHEIEFDLWPSRDGVPVVCHDEDVSRTTDGRGMIREMDWAELQRLDAGVKHGHAWRGVRIPQLAEVLEMVDGRLGLNVHIKDAGPKGRLVERVCDILREQGLTELAYIAGCTVAVLQTAREYAPEIPRACLLSGEDPDLMVKMAEKYACRRVQFARVANADQIRVARKAGLICNLFWSDEINDAREYVRKGVDVVLTNCAHRLIADGFPGRASMCASAPPAVASCDSSWKK